MRVFLYITFILTIIISSCSEIIEMNLNNKDNNRLVVEGSITSEKKKHLVKLSRTNNYFSNQPASRELGATVSITDGSNIYYLTDDNNNGNYFTEESVNGIAGNTYRLDIELANGERYFAESFLKPVSEMDSLTYEYKKSERPFSENYFYYIYLYSQEPETLRDCYQWELFIDGVHRSDTLRRKTFVSDEAVNGVYISKWPIYEISEDKFTNDTTMVKIQMLSISKEKYDFMLALMVETDYAASGFNGPPANIPSNISNGALGFFSASDVVEDSLEVYFRKNVY